MQRIKLPGIAFALVMAASTLTAIAQIAVGDMPATSTARMGDEAGGTANVMPPNGVVRVVDWALLP